ncbi:hypothetical protein DPEC_G00104790 [Dallia pectoralis]|uniref:Uncharacterized protein n=1 Tax=Dallia pectoralis TaxID=75939 RepID=A0ACC2GY77_DALPE|nr:hypothetical protein DPEC_G00104790 [Dallia pectoralis]
MMTTKQHQQEKSYDPRDSTLKFVNRKDEITGDDYVSLRAEMSCGHAATPESVTGWCYELLRQKQYKFTCPADKNGRRCGAEWTYQEVCKMACLTTKEMQELEQTMAELAQPVKQCPGCRSYLRRTDPTNLRVLCTTCCDINGQPFEFCWQCKNQWRGPQPRADRCANHNCTNETLELLKNCPLTTLFGYNDCPSIRACPTCGTVLRHKGTGCNNLTCPTCMSEFCFLCLKLTIICEEGSLCSVVPRQTSIPTQTK